MTKWRDIARMVPNRVGKQCRSVSPKHVSLTL